ncbi:MAG: TetM/TetW/TetO/TetS family tetracycline resistance ribosomal protection protein, partial [Butyrivibrio sp.]|nr:TetM/TetW/TetO/TetS family tetracycline resistance ribosomal protection protein [Butyrivibrio sp.]
MSDHLSIGILAHVDAGKTTLSEALLFLTGSIRKVGRVDHGDAFLDTYSLERSRGITIFSKQAQLKLGDYEVALIDTPGHSDFSPEMERTLQILDYAVLVISAADGVTGQVSTLWKLLEHYNVPAFIFVNKMDQPGSNCDAILKELKEKLSSNIVSFNSYNEEDEDGKSLGDELMKNSLLQEEIAVCDDDLLQSFLEGTVPSISDVQKLILERKLYPCFWGSALKMKGISSFIESLSQSLCHKDYPNEFGARVFKISRDSTGNRLTWMKITGGTLPARKQLKFIKDETEITEKTDQIRVYSGEKFTSIPEAVAGQVVAVTGLSLSKAGLGLGIEEGITPEVLQPILTCEIILPQGSDKFKAYQDFRHLEEEEPMLRIIYHEDSGEIDAKVMGQVQMEILHQLILERFNMDVSFGPGHIVYKETIKNPIEGVGHFEPLRHYAEVHLLLEPGEPGSGMHFDSNCPVDTLDKNWQRLVLTHLEEKQHIGVLTGSELTDMKITLIAGRAHEKHTEGGDFREATYRAIRQGLMMAENVLLEPVYNYRIELPQASLGRALSDIQRMSGTNDAPDSDGTYAVITGTVPASELLDYAGELASYTGGLGKLSLELKGYEPCHNAEEVITRIDYYPELDTENPSSSVFCSHGSGTVIPWDEVRNYMHVESGWMDMENAASVTDLTADEKMLEAYKANEARKRLDRRSFTEQDRDYRATENELKEIFERTYGPIKSNVGNNDEMGKKVYHSKTPNVKYRAPKPPVDGDEYLLVDGYNIIYASEELKALAQTDLKAARDKLMDILADFQGYRKEIVILVFDAYRVPGGTEHVEKYHNLDVVFTKEAETADQYIERTAHEISKKHRVAVATSDAIEQVIILGSSMRLSARDFWNEVEYTKEQVREHIEGESTGL